MTYSIELRMSQWRRENGQKRIHTHRIEASSPEELIEKLKDYGEIPGGHRYITPMIKDDEGDIVFRCNTITRALDTIQFSHVQGFKYFWVCREVYWNYD